jgi:hypothetical protein
MCAPAVAAAAAAVTTGTGKGSDQTTQCAARDFAADALAVVADIFLHLLQIMAAVATAAVYVSTCCTLLRPYCHQQQRGLCCTMVGYDILQALWFQGRLGPCLV